MLALLGGDLNSQIIEENGTKFLRITTNEGVLGSYLIMQLYRNEVLGLEAFSSMIFKVRWSYADESVRTGTFYTYFGNSGNEAEKADDRVITSNGEWHEFIFDRKLGGRF